MHDVRIPQPAYRLASERRHSRRLLEALVPGRAAFLVIDMQNAFVEDASRFSIPNAKELVPRINGIASACRNVGARVIWLRTNFQDQAEAWSVWFSKLLRPDVAAEMIQCLMPGSHGYELHKELEQGPHDLHVTKTRFSPFIEGSSDLHRALRSASIDTLIVAGTVTNTCCETTARDAMMLNYGVVLLSDCNAARTDDEHNGALGNMLQTFGDVATTLEVLERLSRA